MKSVQSDQTNINYQSVGHGDITLLFIHGAYIDQSYWASQVYYFSSRYRVVTLDLPGHGGSGRNRDQWTVARFGQDIVALLDQLDLRKVVLIGHSMGGDIALEAAIARPERVSGIIGIDHFKNAGTALTAAQEEQVEQIMGRLRTEFANTNENYARMVLLTAQTDSVITRRVVADYRNAYPTMGLPMMQDVFGYYQRQQQLLPQLRLKLHLINVTYLPTEEAPLQELAGASYELHPLPGTCHFPMLEKPAELNALLEQTIQKIANGRS